MKNKAYISKSIATLLCIITMTISFNIYLSFKDLYISNDLPSDSIIYIAAAKASLKNSNTPIDDTNNPSIKLEEVSKNKSVVNLNKDDTEQRIFINILILLFSFISLASVHNFIINTEENKEYNSKNLFNTAINKNPNKKSPSLPISKEGAKRC